MTYKVKIDSLISLEEIPNYWTGNDYRQLLELFGFSDAKSTAPENLLEMLQMAIVDHEPVDAARIVLQYKLSDTLNQGQIDQMSHDMLLDKISEEYPNISLHYPLYNINQLLYKAFNGSFPNTKATLLGFIITNHEAKSALSKADLLRLLQKALAPGNLIVRMFEVQLASGIAFPDAESILWELRTEDHVNYQVITSEYWVSRDDIVRGDFEAEIEDIN